MMVDAFFFACRKVLGWDESKSRYEARAARMGPVGYTASQMQGTMAGHAIDGKTRV